MALASEDEWESDPELKEMRREFVASFEPRRLALEALLPALRQGRTGDGPYQEAVQGAARIAHKLAGAAESYGFPTLTLASAAFETWFDSPTGGRHDGAFAFTQLLGEMLAGAQASGKDDKKFSADPRLVQLIAAAKEEK